MANDKWLAFRLFDFTSFQSHTNHSLFNWCPIISRNIYRTMSQNHDTEISERFILPSFFLRKSILRTKEIHLLKRARNRVLTSTQILVWRNSLKQNVQYDKGCPLRIYEEASSCSCGGKLQGRSSDVQVGAGEPLHPPLQALPPRPRSRLSSIRLYIGKRIVQGQKSCLQVSSNREQLLRWIDSRW